jgi:hypothetical protein
MGENGAEIAGGQEGGWAWNAKRRSSLFRFLVWMGAPPGQESRARLFNGVEEGFQVTIHV